MQSFYWLLDFSYGYSITLKGNVHREGAVALESEEREPQGTERVLQIVTTHSTYWLRPNSPNHPPTKRHNFGSFLCKNYELANLKAR